MDNQDPQAQVAASVARRGYRNGWTAPQFLTRQVAKLAEEVGELAEAFDPTDPGVWLLFDAIAGMGARAGRVFDKLTPWGSAVVIDIDALKSEAAGYRSCYST
jgi:NTP pyrophosphatase (non-canonical NTP hydrolase)